MSETTVIRDAAWVVAWDADAGRHTYQCGVDVAFTDDRIVHVGSRFDGAVDRELDGRARLVMPGLVDVHSHPHHEASYKGVREDHGRPEMYDTGLFERSCALGLDADGSRAGAEYAYCELLLGGVTTLADLSSPLDGWLDLIARSGLRGFVAPGFSSARWKMGGLHRLDYEWDEARGRRGMDEAIRLMDEAQAHPCGRLTGVVYPYQIDTCSEELLRDCAAHSEESGRPLTTHAAQAQVEFLEMARRHGCTPIQWAADIGFLGPRTILGHAIFIDEHPSIRWRVRRDLDLLADTGTSIAHCPSPFARYGHALNHFGRYRERGINIGMGTDVAPHNLIEEMRLAVIVGRLMAEDIRSIDTGDAFHAGTVGGATALGRDDLGRIATGAKADIVLVDLEHPQMRPVRDPVRTLMFEAADRAVRDVYVDGRQVVEDGRVLGLDMNDAAGRLEEGQARMLADAPRRDFLGRDASEIAPLSMPVAWPANR